MRVLITGGAGFLGRRLAERLLGDRRALAGLGELEHLRVVDLALARLPEDARLEVRVSALETEDELRAAVADVDLVFHLAAVVSGAAEADFDLGMRVNLDLTRRLLEALRRTGGRPRLVFASSIAVFGGALPEVVTDATRLTPQTSYGTQKAIGELLIADYSRKGFIDGRSIRLPTITVRAGRPNRAASTFASTIIRDPVAGREAICPVRPETAMYVLSPQRAVDAFIRAATLPAEAWDPARAVTLPGLTVTVREMVAALARVAGAEVAARLRFAPDPLIQRIVDGWPQRFDAARARAMGFEADADFDAIVRAHLRHVGAAPARR